MQAEAKFCRKVALQNQQRHTTVLFPHGISIILNVSCDYLSYFFILYIFFACNAWVQWNITLKCTKLNVICLLKLFSLNKIELMYSNWLTGYIKKANRINWLTFCGNSVATLWCFQKRFAGGYLIMFVVSFMHATQAVQDKLYTCVQTPTM